MWGVSSIYKKYNTAPSIGWIANGDIYMASKGEN